MFTDSQSALDLITNVFGTSPRCRHFNRDVNYVRQCVVTGAARTTKVATKMNPSDMLTKLVDGDKVDLFGDMLLRGPDEAVKSAEAKG